MIDIEKINTLLKEYPYIKALKIDWQEYETGRHSDKD